MKKPAVAVGLIIVAVAAAWLFRPKRAWVDCSDAKIEQRATVHFRGDELYVGFPGRISLGLIRDLFGMFVDDGGTSLSTRLQLVAPIQPGTHHIEGDASIATRGEWSFTPAPGHAPLVKSASLVHSSSFGSSAAISQHVSGELIIETATETTLSGRLELAASGDVGCRGRARITTPFELNLKRGESY